MHVLHFVIYDDDDNGLKLQLLTVYCIVTMAVYEGAEASRCQ